jgi:hypothetical protein
LAETTFPLTVSQQGMWFRLVPDRPTFNVPFRSRFRGALNTGALAGALERVVSRQDGLRAYFPAVGGNPVQAFRTSLPIACPVVVIGAMDRDQREEECQRRAQEEAFRLFDLDHGPLIRAKLFQLDRDEYVFVLTLHHLVVDEWSTRILFREIRDTYAAFTRGHEPALPELPMSFAQWALTQHRSLSGSQLDRLVTYWSSQLIGAKNTVRSVFMLSDSGFARKSTAPGQGLQRKLHQTLSPETTRRVREFARRQGATVFIVLLTVFKIVLMLRTGDADVVVTCPVTSRPRTDLEGLIGMFMNNLPLRTVLAPNLTVGDAVKRVRDVVLDAIDHEDIPYDILRSRVPLETLRSLWGVAMEHHHSADVEGLSLEGMSAEFYGELNSDAWDGARKFDLALSVTERKDYLGLFWPPCLLDFIAESQVQATMDDFGRLLELALTDVDRKLSQLL